jgi:hypothetical protein
LIEKIENRNWSTRRFAKHHHPQKYHDMADHNKLECSTIIVVTELLRSGMFSEVIQLPKTDEGSKFGDAEFFFLSAMKIFKLFKKI